MWEEFKFPLYVCGAHDSLSRICFKLISSLEGRYYRSAGNWEIRTQAFEGKLFVNEPDGPLMNLHGLKLIECTEEEWRKSNLG